jgi:hypothetical protein
MLTVEVAVQRVSVVVCVCLCVCVCVCWGNLGVAAGCAVLLLLRGHVVRWVVKL